MFSPNDGSIVLISTRDLIEVSLDEYIEILLREFTKGTKRIDSDIVSGKIRVNHKSTVPIEKNDVIRGVDCGLELRKERWI